MSNSDATDETLIKQAGAGDGSAFACLVERHYMTMYKMAYKYAGNREDAEDIAQDSAIKLARNLGSFNFDAAFTTWLYRLVINTAKDHLKKKNRNNSREDVLYDDSLTVAADDNQEQAYARRQILQAVGELPDKMRDVVILVCWEGLSHREAADILEIAENTVSWRLHEIRKYMNDAYGKEVGHG
ncbi:MAG: RNA polymerase sigma factor [Pseudomonadota bacterium]